jgi:tetratricopeptide (TPR) repeat protein
VYIYLPLAASQSPLMNWGDPSTFERFWWHISGRQYQGYFDFSFSRITEFLYLAAREFGLWWKPFALVTAIVGSLYLTRRDIAMFWALALIIVADLLYCLSYPIAEDKDAYYLPAFMALTIAVGFGVHFLVTVTQNLTSKPIFTLGRTSAILLVIPLVAVTSNFDFANRSRYFIAHDYVDNMFSSVEPGGMLLTSDWQAYAPSLYVRDVEGQRKDIIFIDINLLRRSWYFSYLDQAYPEVTARSRGVIDIYLADLRAFEKDPRAFEKNTSLNLQINRRFEDMLLALAISQLEHAPLYLTLELVDPTRSAQDSELTKKLMEKYDFIPQGLIFRANGKNAPIDLNETELTIRGFSDGTLKFDDDDIVNKSVKPVYLDMFTNSGMVLAAKGRHDKAIVMFNQALKVDPNFEPAKKALGQSRRALQKRPG